MQLPKEHSIILTRNIENLLQGLIDRMLKPCLPYLQLSLVIGELTKGVDRGGGRGAEQSGIMIKTRPVGLELRLW